MHHDQEGATSIAGVMLPAAERRWLLISSAGAAAIAVFAIVWGLFAQSRVILLDGVYATVTIGLTWLALRASSAMEKGPTDRYPFGREALAPLMVAVQALVLLGTFGYAVLDAIIAIIHGGTDTAVGAALLYAVVTTVVALALWLALRRKHGQSDLVDAEASQWLAGLMLSVAMIVGFGIAFGLEKSDWAHAARYVDPVLVLVSAVIFVPVPLQMLRHAGAELLEATPPAEVSDPVYAAIESVRTEFGLPDPQTRIGKLGRKLYVEVDFLVGDAGWTIEDADRVRRAMSALMKRPGQLLWLNVEIHSDPHWDD
jgi:cation diffusion facilitator family transporter